MNLSSAQWNAARFGDARAPSDEMEFGGAPHNLQMSFRCFFAFCRPVVFGWVYAQRASIHSDLLGGNRMRLDRVVGGQRPREPLLVGCRAGACVGSSSAGAEVLAQSLPVARRSLEGGLFVRLLKNHIRDFSILVLQWWSVKPVGGGICLRRFKRVWCEISVSGRFGEAH